jgi:hypothetical protein
VVLFPFGHKKPGDRIRIGGKIQIFGKTVVGYISEKRRPIGLL